MKPIGDLRNTIDLAISCHNSDHTRIKMWASKLVAIVAVLSCSADALKWMAPRATAVSFLSSEASKWTAPKVTLAPYAPYDLLRKRQSEDLTITALQGPDNTCGFFGGRPGAPLSCPTTDTCLMLQTAGGPGAIGCCPISAEIAQCGFRIKCIDYDTFYNTTGSCNGDCVHDTHTLKCTATTARFCNSIYWPQNNVQDYFCDDVHISSLQTLFTTYSGETGRTWATALISSESSTSPVSTTTDPSTTTDTDAPLIPSSTSTSTPPPTPVPVPGPKKSTPVGPIVGGVVGGVAVLAGLITALVFFRRHRNKKNAAAAVGPAADPNAPPVYSHPDHAAMAAAMAGKPTGQTAAYPVNPDTNSYYDPKTASQYGAQPSFQQGSPEMAQQHGFAPMPVGGYYPQQQNQGYYNPNQSPHLSAGYPNRSEATSPVSNPRYSEAGLDSISPGSAPGPHSGYTSPRPGYTEMSANMAGGPFPQDQHEGTWEVEGSGVPPKTVGR